MSIGIGAAGIAGMAVEQLVMTTVTGSATAGGSLTAGTYKYYVTVLNANGESTVSNEVTVTTSAGNLTAHLTWTPVTGSTGFKVYRTASGGASDTELLIATLGVVAQYDDTAVGSPSGAFPTTNTAVAPGVYVAPTKFFPFTSESIKTTQDTVWRRPIRQSADIIGAIPGNFHVEGELNLESLEDVVLWFLWASRTTIVKSGSNPNFIYTITPTPAAVANKTLSITIVRNGVVHGYTGVCLSNFKFGIDNGILTFNTNVLGRDEASQSLPVPTWPTSTPFGAGMYSIEIPTGAPVLDTDTFEFSVEDNAEAQFRLKSTGRGAQFIKYGERSSTMTMERDFENRTDYDAYKAYTSQSITLTASKGVNNQISLLAPVAIKDTYEVGLSGQGDLVRASISYQDIVDGTGKSWQIVIKTQEDIIP